jgi:glycosyltransferase involved in cell wall biosynthesis
MTVRPLVSIIVNNYNYARFLRDAIDSALAQTYAPLEVIVVDDGSTDESRAIITEYGARIIPVFKENGGQASAFNAGFAASHGDVVIFLDADDILLPSAAAQAVPLFEDGVAKVHWSMPEVDVTGRRTGVVHPDRPLGEGNLRQRTIEEGPLAGIAPPTSGNAWARTLLEQILPVPEDEFRINTDGYLHTLVWMYGEARVLADPQSLYRMHGSNHFASRSAEDKLERHRAKFVHQCRALASHLAAQGVSSRPEIWKLRKGIRDAEVHAAGKAALRDALPPDANIILVDDGAWANPDDPTPIAGASILPFLSRSRVYHGTPDDDAEAIAEVERLRREGADFLVFPWFSFWWFSAYPGFRDYLWQSCAPGVWTDFLAILDLRDFNRNMNLRHALERAIPQGDHYALVDESCYAYAAAPGLLIIPDRKVSHFMMQGGLYYGLPADDAAALEELARLQTDGANFIVFPSFTFWWLDYYQGFARHLEENFRRVIANGDIVVFETISREPSPVTDA